MVTPRPVSPPLQPILCALSPLLPCTLLQMSENIDLAHSDFSAGGAFVLLPQREYPGLQASYWLSRLDCKQQHLCSTSIKFCARKQKARGKKSDLGVLVTLICFTHGPQAFPISERNTVISPPPRPFWTNICLRVAPSKQNNGGTGEGHGPAPVWKGTCSVVEVTPVEGHYVKPSMRKHDTVADKLPRYPLA